MPILCSQKPPVTCHVTQDDSRCPSRTHTSWSSVGLWPRLLLPSASFCSRHLALWVFWAGSFFGALPVSAWNALFQVSTWLTAILASVSPFWTTQPQIATWHPQASLSSFSASFLSMDLITGQYTTQFTYLFYYLHSLTTMWTSER